MLFESLRCSIGVDAPGEESYDSPVTKAAQAPAWQGKVELVIEPCGNLGVKLST